MSMVNYLNIIVLSPCGKHEWSSHGIAVPRIGDYIHVTMSRTGETWFDGEVEDICWGLRAKDYGPEVGIGGEAGMVVTVSLKHAK